jgi:hypothetical protein
MKKTADGHVTNLTKLSAQNPCKLWNQMFVVTISTADYLAEVFGCFNKRVISPFFLFLIPLYIFQTYGVFINKVLQVLHHQL